MEHFFVDTDVIIDFLGDRHPFSTHAAALFIKAQENEIKIYTSSNSITTAYYILCKTLPDKKVRGLIPLLVSYISVIPVTEKMITEASYSAIKDFEDAVQNFAALSNSKIGSIITRNTKDFKNSKLPVYLPETVLLKLG